MGSLDFRFSILDFRLGATAPDLQAERQLHQSKIENRESKIPKIENPGDL
jgi:hypothetical protein